MTVIIVERVMAPDLAEIEVVPPVNAEANPEALIVATVVLEEDQVTVPVMVWVDPSE
jgi:hypothetical protein